jgi:hypothetical protein
MFTTRPHRFVPSVYGDAGGAGGSSETEARVMVALPALIAWAQGTISNRAITFPYWLDKKGGTYRFHGDRIEVIKPYSKVIYFDASKRSASEKSGSELARILDELKTRGEQYIVGDNSAQLLKALRENSTEELYDYLRETRKAKEKKETKKETKKATTTTTAVATTSTFVPSTYSTYTPTPAAATTTAPAPVAKKKKAKRKAPTPFFKQPWFPFAVGGVALLLFLGVGLAVRSGRRGQAALPAPAPTKVMA